MSRVARQCRWRRIELLWGCGGECNRSTVQSGYARPQHQPQCQCGLPNGSSSSSSPSQAGPLCVCAQSYKPGRGKGALRWIDSTASIDRIPSPPKSWRWAGAEHAINSKTKGPAGVSRHALPPPSGRFLSLSRGRCLTCGGCIGLGVGLGVESGCQSHRSIDPKYWGSATTKKKLWDLLSTRCDDDAYPAAPGGRDAILIDRTPTRAEASSKSCRVCVCGYLAGPFTRQTFPLTRTNPSIDRSMCEDRRKRGPQGGKETPLFHEGLLA
jgi:hypothetical protein